MKKKIEKEVAKDEAKPVDEKNQAPLMAKAEEEEEKEEGEGEGDEEEEEEEEKSLTAGDLAKSLRKLEEFAKSDDAPSRKEALLKQASNGDLSKAEREELFGILGGGEVVEEKTEDAIVKGLSENENLQKALDVSEYLQEQHTELVKSLKAVGEEIEKSDHRRHEFNLVLAKAVCDIGELTKAISESVAQLAGQPAHAPKSVGVTTKPAQVLQKSFAGQPAGDQLSKSQVLDALDGLMEESINKGMGGALETGDDLSIATSKYEQTNMISKNVLEAVKGFMQRKQA